MKQLLFLIVIVSISPKLRAQTTAGCDMTWSNPVTVLTNKDGNISYRIQFSKCTSSGICGWPKVALQHSFGFPVSISLKLTGVTCDGKTATASFNTSGNEIAPDYEYIQQGNWHTFRSITEVASIEVNYKSGNDKWRIVYNKSVGKPETFVNGMPLSSYKAAPSQQQQQKEKQTAAISLPTQTTKSSGKVQLPPARTVTSSQPVTPTPSQNIYNSLNEKTKQNQQIANTFVEGVQGIGNILAQANQRKANEAAYKRAQDQQEALDEQQERNDRRQHILSRVGEGGIKDVTEYGAIYLNDFKDSTTAFTCFAASADADDPKAMLWLALCYHNGIGTNVNDTAAAYWLQRAADFGERTAIHYLGKLYANGKWPTIAQNTDAAIKWTGYNIFLGQGLDLSDKSAINADFSNNGYYTYYIYYDEEGLTGPGGLSRRDLYDYNSSHHNINWMRDLIDSISSYYEQKGTTNDLQAAILWQQYKESISHDKSYSEKRTLKKIAEQIKALQRLQKQSIPGDNDITMLTSDQLFNKGLLFYFTPGGKDSAKYYLTLAANGGGDREAQFILGMIEHKANNDKAAVQIFVDADNGIGSYMSSFGGRLLVKLADSAVVQKAYNTAFQYYLQLANNALYNGLIGINQLINLYSTGVFTTDPTKQQVVPIDNAEAEKWRQKNREAWSKEKLVQYR